MTNSEEILDVNGAANTYPGKRNDLRNGDEDDIDVPDIADIKKWAKRIALEDRGITAYALAEQAGISKEWARKILNRMHADGELTCRQFSQLKLFGIPDIPCPHCGEMMSAYIRSGSCNRCLSSVVAVDVPM